MAATIPFDCPQCGRRIDYAVGESLYGTSYAWWVAYRCTGCGAAMEGDGKLPLPDDLRQVLLEQEGEWALHMAPVGAQTVASMRVLRKALGLSITETSKLRARWPGVVATGTRGEMGRLHRLLVAEGLECSSVRAMPAQSQDRASPDVSNDPDE